MTEPVVIEIPGEVVAKGAPRFARRGVGQTPLAYTPEKTRIYMDSIRFEAHRAMAGRPLMTGPVLMRLTAYKPYLKSWSKKDLLAAMEGKPPITKPDLSNYIKLAEDALNGVVFCDDSQIVEHVARKEYSNRPRLQIIVAPWSHWTERRAAA